MNGKHWRNMADCATERTLKDTHMQITASVSLHQTPHSRTNFDKTCQLTGTVRGPARRPHISLAITAETVQIWTQVLGVISAYFNIRNTLTMSVRNLIIVMRQFRISNETGGLKGMQGLISDNSAQSSRAYSGWLLTWPAPGTRHSLRALDYVPWIHRPHG
jgi:hypothetical protein